MRFELIPHGAEVPQSEAFGDHAHNIVTVGQIIAHSKARDEVDGDTLRLQARHHVRYPYMRSFLSPPAPTGYLGNPVWLCDQQCYHAYTPPN